MNGYITLYEHPSHQFRVLLDRDADTVQVTLEHSDCGRPFKAVDTIPLRAENFNRDYAHLAQETLVREIVMLSQLRRTLAYN